MTQEYIISLKNLCKSYNTKENLTVEALKDINLDVKRMILYVL